MATKSKTIAGYKNTRGALRRQQLSQGVAQAQATLEKCIDADRANEIAGKHYDLEKPVKESIELIEIIMERKAIPPVARFMISQTVRYLLRCGVKSLDWKKDVAKARNYLNRALDGVWFEGKD